MTILNFVFSAYFVSVSASVLLILLLYFVFKYHREEALKKALDFSLFEVSFPRLQKEEGKTLKDMIVVMEQFYAGMSSVKPHFCLEISSPAAESETNFYIAVPTEYRSLFENQVRSTFPKAEIRPEKDDYNIFKFKGGNAGAAVSLKANWVLPIKTYENLNADPLEIIANAFSELKRENEGAALQIIVDPSENKFRQDIEKSIKLLQSGQSVKTALKGGESLIGSLFKVLSGGLIHQGAEEKETTFLPQTQELRKEIIEALNKKIKKPIFRVNIRLAASAQTNERARQILEEIKSYFYQFNEPQANSLTTTSLSGHSLKKLLYNFSFRLFNRGGEIYLNTEELASLFHFPAYEMFAPKMKFLRLKKTEPPVNLPKEGIVLGKNDFRGGEIQVRMAKDDRRRHFYMIGQTGTGKSVLLKNMVLQDIKNGEGLCFIDPHGDSIEEILGQIPAERMEDVVYFNPGDISRPFGLNMLEYDQNFPEQKTFIVNELLEIFNKLYDMSVAGGPMFEQYFRNATLLVMDDPASGNTLLEISRVLTDKEFRHRKLSRSNNPVVKNFWSETAEKAGGEASLQNMVPYISSKFDTFLANEIMRPIIAQEKSSFNFREIMDNKKIFLVNLAKGRLGETNAYLLGMIIAGKLFMSAMSRVDLPEDQRKDFYFYIDEFQNITTKSVANILSEARKYRLSLIIAHQFIAQLEEEIKKAVFGNVGSLACFRVGKEDAEFLVKNFEPVFSQEDLMNIANYHAYLKLLIHGETARPFNIETYPPQPSDPVAADKVKELSAVKYGRPRSQVESEISQKYLKSVKLDEKEES